MWWPWRRRRLDGRARRLFDGDTVVPPGQRRSAEILAGQPGQPREAMTGPTAQFPLVVESSPLTTPAQWWRGNGGRS